MSLFIHKLIHEMSTSEKVFFKRMTKIHSASNQKNYINLYHILEGMKKYNQDVLYKAIKGTTLEKFLSSELNYLKSKILTTLFNFNINKTNKSRIQKNILMIDVLIEKNYRKEALKLLKATKKKAKKREDFTWLFRLIELEENIFFQRGHYWY